MSASVASILIVLAVAMAVGAAASTGVIFRPGAWYRGLVKPAWTPPNWLFPVAWGVIYVLTAAAAWRVGAGLADGGWGPEASAAAAAGLAFWAAQMVLNALWSPIFFGAHRARAGLICIAALWLALLITLILFAMADGWAALMLVPYLVWASYAGTLNAAILRLNPPETWGRPEDDA